MTEEKKQKQVRAMMLKKSREGESKEKKPYFDRMNLNKK